jgi:hypothetical protein
MRARTAAAKTRVFAALGNRCACLGTACYHSSRCLISEPAVLEIDHMNQDGARIRRPRFSTKRFLTTTACRWARYARDLDAGSHAMQLLCANCHRWLTVLRRGRRPT